MPHTDTFLLLPNYDDTQDTGFPLGDKEEEVVTIVPVDDLVATTQGTSSIRLSSVDVGSRSVSIFQSTDANNYFRLSGTYSLPYNVTALPSDTTHYFYVSTDEEGQGFNASNYANAKTDEIITQPPGPTPGGGDTILQNLEYYENVSQFNLGYSPEGQISTVNDPTNSGFKVWRSDNIQGSEGYGNDGNGNNGRRWGTLPNYTCAVGDELWTRVYVYHPPGFDFRTGSKQNSTTKRKSMRMRSHGGGNAQWVDMPYWTEPEPVYNSSSPDYLYNRIPGDWNMNRESANLPVVVGKNSTYAFRTNQWDCVETYIRWGLNDNDGLRCAWFNGVRMLDSNGNNAQGFVPGRTLWNSAGGTMEWQWIAWWNGGVRRTQHHYIASGVLALRKANRSVDDTPSMDRDELGFPFIGTKFG